MNYYNENDKKAAAWLRELIKANLIANGEVDERSITEVHPNDLVRFTQCHFFAGIGGWSYALRLAGWPDDKPVWTGSCPCQPFSVAGKGLGEQDERHLWPIFRELIRACKPPTIFGEQVASAAGRQWLSGVFADLEAMAYQRAAVDLCAAGVNAPHIRQRLWWVAHANRKGCEGREWRGEAGTEGQPGRHPSERGRSGFVGWLVNSNSPEKERFGCISIPLESKQETRRPGNANAWSNFETVGCADGKTRRIESGTFPLAHGVSGRVGLLRGYGNAIVPQLAAEFIQAFQEAVNQIESTR